LWEFLELVLKELEAGANSQEGKQATDEWERSERALTKSVVDTIFEAQDKTERGWPETFYLHILESARPIYDLKILEPLSRGRASQKAVVWLRKALVHFVDNPEKTWQLLIELGTRHYAYRITEIMLRSSIDYFYTSCAEFLPPGFITRAVRWRFTKVYTTLVDGMVAGLNDGIDLPRNLIAPKGPPVAVLFTDIEKSTNLWKKYPVIMDDVIKEHNTMIRRIISECGAYEVKTIGDSFYIVVKSIAMAVLMAVQIQLDFMLEAPIHPQFKMLEDTEGSGEGWVDSSIRVRVGIDFAMKADEVHCAYDPVPKRWDYFGNVVNRAARIESDTCGGQVQISDTAYRALVEDPMFHELLPIDFSKLQRWEKSSGKHKMSDQLKITLSAQQKVLKGVGVPLDLYSVAPACLSGRIFPE